MLPGWQVQLWHPTQKSEHAPYLNGWNYETENYGNEAKFGIHLRSFNIRYI
jgi:hypothetical protein